MINVEYADLAQSLHLHSLIEAFAIRWCILYMVSDHNLMLSLLGKNFGRRHFEIFFLFYSEYVI